MDVTAAVVGVVVVVVVIIFVLNIVMGEMKLFFVNETEFFFLFSYFYVFSINCEKKN